jgi:hypothetical protein
VTLLERTDRRGPETSVVLLDTRSLVPHSMYFSHALAIPSRSPRPSCLARPRFKVSTPRPKPGHPCVGSRSGLVQGRRYASRANAGKRDEGSRAASSAALWGYFRPICLVELLRSSSIILPCMKDSSVLNAIESVVYSFKKSDSPAWARAEVIVGPGFDQLLQCHRIWLRYTYRIL